MMLSEDNFTHHNLPLLQKVQKYAITFIMFRLVSSKIEMKVSDEKMLEARFSAALGDFSIETFRKNAGSVEIQRIANRLGMELTPFQVTEALFTAKGGYMQKGQGEFNPE